MPAGIECLVEDGRPLQQRRGNRGHDILTSGPPSAVVPVTGTFVPLPPNADDRSLDTNCWREGLPEGGAAHRISAAVRGAEGDISFDGFHLTRQSRFETHLP
jgi:hypothetical protein